MNLLLTEKSMMRLIMTWYQSWQVVGGFRSWSRHLGRPRDRSFFFGRLLNSGFGWFRRLRGLPLGWRLIPR